VGRPSLEVRTILRWSNSFFAVEGASPFTPLQIGGFELAGERAPHGEPFGLKPGSNFAFAKRLVSVRI
jgi:hypothetical protein